MRRYDNRLAQPVAHGEGDQHGQGARQDRRGADGAEAHPTVGRQLGEEVAQGGAERAGEHEGEPEQGDRGHPGEVPRQRDRGDQAADQQRAAGKAQPGVVGQVVAQRRAQRVGESIATQ